MEKIARRILLMSLLLLLFSCEKEKADDCFRSHGDTTSKTRSLSSFTKLQVEGVVTVQLIPGTESKVTVTGGKNFLQQIHTEVRDGTLYVKENIGCKFVRSYSREYSVDIHYVQLNEIAHYGSKHITSDSPLNSAVLDIDKWAGGGDVILPVSSDSLFVRIHAGSGDVTVTGKSDFGYVYQRGFGFMFLDELSLQNCYVDKGGTGDCHVMVKDTATVDFNSYGTLIISGNPNVNITKQQGEGDVVILP